MTGRINPGLRFSLTTHVDIQGYIKAGKPPAAGCGEPANRINRGY